MPSYNAVKMRCDLCKWPERIFDSEREAKETGWIIVGQEGFYDDRSFFDTCICPSCVKKIEAALTKRGTAFVPKPEKR